MRTDPVVEWRRLTEHYRQMSEGELRELARAFPDLTDTAQQALRGEFRGRGLGDPQAPTRASVAPEPARVAQPINQPSLSEPATDFIAGHLAQATQIVPDSSEDEDEDNGPHEYTWKTILCECEEPVQAQLLVAALNRAGIECWIENQGTRSRYTGMGLDNPRVLVAADQLEQARMIAAKPIPQDIIDESKLPPAEFEMPRCPRCRAADPVLVEANPVNTWRCEQCGKEWTESETTGSIEGSNSAEIPS
jgi:hypothetical protein